MQNSTRNCENRAPKEQWAWQGGRLALRAAGGLWAAFVVPGVGHAAAETWAPAGDKISGEILYHQRMKERPDAMTAAEHASKLAAFGLNAQNLKEEDCALYVTAPLTDAEIAGLANQGIGISRSNWVPPVPGKHAHGFYLATADYASLDLIRADARFVRVESTERAYRPLTNLGRAAIGADGIQSGGGGCGARVGSGVDLAIADTGIDLYHPDFPVPVEAFDMTDGTDPSTWGTNVANTFREHGTHVTAIAVGSGLRSAFNQYRGVAPGANLHFYKVANDSTGQAGGTDLIEAVNRALAVGCDIFSLSYGGTVNDYLDGSSPLCQAIDNAVAGGMTCFVAAGNDGSTAIHDSLSVAPGMTSAGFGYTVTNPNPSSAYAGQELIHVIWRDGVLDGNVTLACANLGAGESLNYVFGNASPRGTEARDYVLTASIAAGSSSKTYTFTLQNGAAGGSTPLVHCYRAFPTLGVFSSPDPNYTVGDPAVADGAIAVGAWVTRNQWTSASGGSFSTGYTLNQIAPFSSLGPRVDGAIKPDIMAPGSGIIACRDSGTWTYPAPFPHPLADLTIDNDGQAGGLAEYYLQHGTSMACPMAAGAAALLVEAYPSLTPGQVRAALTATASNAASPNGQIGYGLINVSTAIFSLDCNANGTSDQCDVTPLYPAFTTQDIFTNRSDRIDLAAGDFDGDNDPDLVEGRLGGDSLRWWRNDGMGGFARVDQFHFQIDDGEYMAAADFDGDGDVDIAAAERTNNQLRVLLNDGSGTFSAGATTFAYVVEEIAADDLDRDNDVDVAVVLPYALNYQVGVLLNNGNATFATLVGYPLPAAPEHVSIGELNGDGFPDLAVATSGGISVLLNNGDGTFAAAVGYGVTYPALAVTLLDADLDGDNDLAAATAYQWTSCNWQTEVRLLRNDGSGAFAAAGTYTGPSYPYCNLYHVSLGAGDIDGDGQSDIVMGAPIGGWGAVWVYPNNGNGTFSYTFPPLSQSVAPNDLALGDWDADGDLDLASANNNALFSVSLNGTIRPTAPDCNGSGFPDACDIAGGASQDCQSDGTPDDCQLAGNDCNANAVPDDCDLAAGTSADSSANNLADECEGIGAPAATVTAAVSRKTNIGGPGGMCDLALVPGVASEPRQGGITELRIAFDVAPGGPGSTPVTLDEKTCASPAYAAYSGSAAMSTAVAANELVLTFTPGLDNGRTYRLTLGPQVTSITGQFVDVRGLMGDVSGDGQVNATDRSLVVGAWTGAGFSCATDLNGDGVTNATDRSLVVGAWTGGANCAP